MCRLWRHLLAVSLLLPASVSHAVDGEIYAGGQAGMFLPIESSVSGDLVGEDAEVTYNAGVVLTAVAGYRFGNGLRGEGEFSYRRLTSDRLYNSAGDFAVDSGIRSYAVMANLYYDFRNKTVITPYVGAGIGGAAVRFGTGRSDGSAYWTSDNDLSFAYQGMAGFEFRIADHTSLDFVYHHFAIPRLHFDTLSAQFRGINLSLGVRHWF